MILSIDFMCGRLIINIIVFVTFALSMLFLTPRTTIFCSQEKKNSCISLILFVGKKGNKKKHLCLSSVA